jgi:hypothetical protein
LPRSRGFSLVSSSRTEQRRRYDGDPVCAAIGVRPGRDDDRVEQVAADVLGEPVQVAGIAVVGHGGELHLDREDAAVATLHDQVNLVWPSIAGRLPASRSVRLTVGSPTPRSQSVSGRIRNVRMRPARSAPRARSPNPRAGLTSSLAVGDVGVDEWRAKQAPGGLAVVVERVG